MCSVNNDLSGFIPQGSSDSKCKQILLGLESHKNLRLVRFPLIFLALSPLLPASLPQTGLSQEGRGSWSWSKKKPLF